MQTLLIILIILASVLLSFLVLIQNPKGGGLAAGFSGGTNLMGVKRTGDILEKGTWGLAIAIGICTDRKCDEPLRRHGTKWSDGANHADGSYHGAASASRGARCGSWRGFRNRHRPIKKSKGHSHTEWPFSFLWH